MRPICFPALRSIPTRLITLINDFLDVGRIDAGALPVDTRFIPLPRPPPQWIAKNGRQAAELSLEGAEFDLVLMDLDMPV